MSYTGFVCQIKNLREHPNGDKLYLGECFGNTVCVSRSGYTDGMLGAYFPTDGQLSVEFATNNNLLRLRDENGHSIPGGGYMDPDKRNVTAIKLRGERSDGLFLPLSCLDYCFDNGAAANLKLGDTISVVNGHEICCKYIPRQQHRRGGQSEGNKTRKKKVNIAPLFMEHVDTEQLAYNLNAFKSGDEIEISLKLHGTSQRTAYLPVLKGYKRTLMDKLFRREGTPIYEYDLITGTRRTIIEDTEGGYYGNNEFRMPHAEQFRGKLWKNETVYYEVVAYTSDGTPIMASGKVPKEYQKQYGEIMEFSYGCSPNGSRNLYGCDNEGPFSLECLVPQSDIYVYRMTMTNEDGNVVEYTPDFMRYRCEQMGVKCVPILWKGTIPDAPAHANATEGYKEITAGEWIKFVAEMYYDGPDPIGKTHVREGVVVRIINRPKFAAYKHKNWLFKYISGIITEAVADGDVNVDEEVLSEL